MITIRRRLVQLLAFVCVFVMGIAHVSTAYAGSAWQYGEWFRGAAVGPVPVMAPGSIAGIRSEYDVIVAGTDPEGIAAAVSAARNDLKVLLVDGNNRRTLGGLMTLGWLNTIDMNRYAPNGSVLNKGIFSEWFKKVEGDSFDVETAARAFRALVDAEPNIDVLMPVRSMEPWVEMKNGVPTIVGMLVKPESGTEVAVRSKAVIDATQDADIAAAAGVPYTFGREDIGRPDARMAVTLVFRLEGVTPAVWNGIRERLRGVKESGANEMTAWGYKQMYQYKPLHPSLKMRGLNIGRQNNGTALVNALLVFNVDPLSYESRQLGREAAMSETARIVDYMKRTFPEFSSIRLGDHAPELYVRESRHIIGEYRLNIIDLLENRDKWDRIGFGSYPVDIQPITPSDNGQVLLNPLKYAVPFRSIVPLTVDGLLVVGRSASFDTLPHGSARTIPVGMAAGQAAGAAVKVATERNLTFRAMSRNETAIRTLQARLNAQGMELNPYKLADQPYMKHKHYEGLKTVLSLGIATGKYNNDFRLDEKANPTEFGWMLAGTKPYFKDKVPEDAMAWMPGSVTEQEALRFSPLSLSAAAHMIAIALELQPGPGQGTALLQEHGYLKPATVQTIGNPNSLTIGETYTLIRDMAAALGYQPPIGTN